ncbi:MAG: YigZ family protein [Bacteroidetes bacterium]|nr:YigZ family protein [Bacteroidota bacterium]
MDFYQTIDKSGSAEFKDRGSKFIAYAYPVDNADQFKKHLQALKKEHAKAVHHCFAYRLGLNGDNFRSSDDGEPSGTAGKPILGQIDSKQLTNTAVIVVRYFGGTLLGVPGLINAYKTSTALVLQTVPIIQKQVEIMYSLQFDYTLMNTVMQLIRQYNCTVLEHEQQLFSLMRIGIPKNRAEELIFRLKEMNGLEYKAI